MEYWRSVGPAHRDFHRNNYKLLASRYDFMGRGNWHNFTCRPFRDYPKFPACYVIQENGITVYVGHTSNLCARMRRHKDGIISEIENPTVKVRFGMKYGDWAMRELRLIRRLKPRYNVHGCRHD